MPANTYSVSLTGYEEGLAYTAVSVSPTMRKVIISLQKERIVYTTTVLTKTGEPAANVTVNWRTATAVAATATTNAQGIASVELDYGNYQVFVTNLPSGNIFEGSVSVSGKNPENQIRILDGETIDYAVTVRTEGGLKITGIYLTAYKNVNDLAITATFGTTDAEGVFKFTLPKGEYTVSIDEIQKGYSTNPVTVSSENTAATMILKSAVIDETPAPDTVYVMGDIIHNYTFTTPYNVGDAPISVSIAELLKTKKAIFINNWGTKCSWCLKEMPAMQEAYEKYGDDIEMIAVSNYQGGDSSQAICTFYEKYGYTFPMMRDPYGLASKFNLTGFPTTVVIDRYGAIARIESGAITSTEIWGRLIEKYIGEDYVQTFVPGTHVSDSINTEISKPDITVPPDHYEKVAEAINNTAQFPAGASVEYYGETESDIVWPFIFGTVEGVSETDPVLYASNTGKPTSISAIYAKVNVSAGKIFTFDYWADTEENYDTLQIVWDGKVIKTISGNSNGWQTCYLYLDLDDGEHIFAMSYVKDNSTDSGKDNIYFKNVRFTDHADMPDDPSDMIRCTAYGTPAEGADRYPYYASIELKPDGYYHVNVSSLENSSFAGNDDSPLVLVNLLNPSNWSSTYSIRQLVLGVDENGDYAVDCNFTVNGVTKDWRETLVEYLYTATGSDIYGFLPLDKELHDLLVEFMKSASGFDSHDNELLEACYFYSHYGNGDPIGNPILGLTDKTALIAEMGTNTADLTKNIQPAPFAIYKFTAPSDGVYKIESLIPSANSAQYAAQAWLFTGSTSGKYLVYSGDTRITRTGDNEHNFEIHRYMLAQEEYYLVISFQMQERGQLDFKITNVGETVTTLLPCSDNMYWTILDDQGNTTDEIELAGAVKYVADNEGYFHAVNPDGSTGDFIYLDVKYPLPVINNVSVTTLVDMFVKDPIDFTGKTNLDYKEFDFRYRVTYYHDEIDNKLVKYDPKVDITSLGENYKDYTDIVKQTIASADQTGETEGLVKVNQEIADLLNMYIENRNNMAMDGYYENALENEWQRFCWYFRTYDSVNR